MHARAQHGCLPVSLTPIQPLTFLGGLHMYYLIRSRGARLAAQELPAGACALAVAETFYRFHSFTLECLAFLATWFVFSWVLSRVWDLGRQLRNRGYRRG